MAPFEKEWKRHRGNVDEWEKSKSEKAEGETYYGVVTEETEGKCLTEWFMMALVGERRGDEGKRQTKLERGRRRERREHLVPCLGQDREESCDTTRCL